MDSNIILGLILLAPVVLLMIMRINAALVFLSLCLGAVLVQFVGGDAADLLSSTSAHSPGISSNQTYVNLGLLLLPVVLTMIIMIRTVNGWTRLAFNILPAIGVGLLGTLLAVPLLSAGLEGSITLLPLWHQLESLQTLTISISTLFCLLFLWMQRSRGLKDVKHGKHH